MRCVSPFQSLNDPMTETCRACRVRHGSHALALRCIAHGGFLTTRKACPGSYATAVHRAAPAGPAARFLIERGLAEGRGGPPSAPQAPPATPAASSGLGLTAR